MDRKKREETKTMMEKYENQIAMGFIDEKELDEFINTIAEDEKLSAKKYQYLRHVAIQRFYEN